MNAIMEGVDGGTIEQTVEGYKRVTAIKPDAELINLWNELEIEIAKMQSTIDSQLVKDAKITEYSTQELLEMQGERQTYIDLETERTGVEPYFYPGAN